MNPPEKWETVIYGHYTLEQREALKSIGRWTREHKDKLMGALVEVEEDRIWFMPVRNQVKFDMKFEDALFDFDLEIFRTGVKIHSMAAQPGDLEATKDFMAFWQADMGGKGEPT